MKPLPSNAPSIREGAAVRPVRSGRCRFWCIGLLALLCVCGRTASAGESVRAGYWYLPGYHEQNAAGERYGYGYEYLEKIASSLGWNMQYVGYDRSWTEMLDMLEKGEIDLLTNATKTPEQERRFDYSAQPIGLSYTVLTVKAGDTRFRPGDYARWNGMRVGMIRGSARNVQFEEFARSKGFRFVPYIYPTYDAFEAALRKGAVDALAATNARKLQDEWVLEKINPAPVYIIVRKGDRKRLAEVNRALALLAINAPQLESLLMQRHYAVETMQSIPLSDEERAFIASSRSHRRYFRALLKPDRAPLSTFRDGKMRGILRDVANLIVRRSGLDIRFVPCQTRADYETALRSGDFDLVFDAWFHYPYAEKHNLYLSEPYLSSSVSLLKLKAGTGTPRRQGALRNSWMLDELRRRGVDTSKFLLCDSTEELVAAVRNGTVDAGYLYTRMANAVVSRDKSMRLTSELVFGLKTDYAVGFNRAVPRELVLILCKAVRSVSEDDIRGVMTYYERVPEGVFTPREWIRKNPIKCMSAIAGVLLTGVALLVYLLFSRRNIYRRGKVLGKLPVRFFVVDRSGYILYFNAPDVRDKRKDWRQTSDFSDPDVAAIMQDAVAEAFEKGSVSVDYKSEGRWRTARVERLAPELFGREAVIWISQNTEELQASRREAREAAARLHAALTQTTELNARLNDRLAIDQLLWDNIPAYIYALDVNDDFRYTICNRHYLKLWGLSESEAIGRNDTEVLGGEAGRLWGEGNRRAAAQAAGGEETIAFTDRAGEPRIGRFFRQCVELSGNRRWLIGLGVDITEQESFMRGEQVIRNCLEMLILEPDMEVAIARAMEAVCRHIGADRTYIMQFDTARKTCSCYKEYFKPGAEPFGAEIRNRPYSSGMDWEDRFRADCFLTFSDLQAPAVQELLGEEWSELSRRLDCRSLYCHRILLGGKFWGYVGLIYEKKERVLKKRELDFIQATARFIEIMILRQKTQAELLDALKQSQAAERAKSLFLATMSHEIRTPLNAVIGFSELLKSSTLPPSEQKNYLNDISSAGNALLALINDILDLSKLEVGQMNFVSVETDFPKLLNEVIAIFQPHCREKNLTISARLEPMPHIGLDRLRIRQILFNLIGNAVKFTDRGSIELSGSFAAGADGDGTLTFAVSDTGVGISEEDQKRLFQPFVQSTALRGTQAANNGTGLGLAIIRRMLRSMGGDITLRSTPGKGSVFTVSLPGRAVAQSQPAAVAAAESRLLPEPSRRSGRVLLVDDIALNLKVESAMLAKLGFRSVLASNAADALVKLEAEPFDLLMTDLWMPEMSGADLARRVRQDHRYDGMKIIAITADTESRVDFDMTIFDRVLTKPVTLEKFQKLLAPGGLTGESGEVSAAPGN